MLRFLRVYLHDATEGTNFEPATRAPLIIRVPGITDVGVTSTAITEHVDLLPTLAAAAGIAVPTCPRDSTAVKVWA